MDLAADGAGRVEGAFVFSGAVSQECGQDQGQRNQDQDRGRQPQAADARLAHAGELLSALDAHSRFASLTLCASIHFGSLAHSGSSDTPSTSVAEASPFVFTITTRASAWRDADARIEPMPCDKCRRPPVEPCCRPGLAYQPDRSRRQSKSLG